MCTCIFEGGTTFLYDYHLLVRSYLTLKVPETKIAEFANSEDLGEMARYEPPHLDLHCLPSSL